MIPMAIGLVVSFSAVQAERPVLSVGGTPGVVDLPSARSLPDGHLAFSSSVLSNSVRNTASFQVLPRVYGTFRYSIFQDFFEDNPDNPTNQLFEQQLFDRSFDVHFRILDEQSDGVDLAVGLRDFLGTGFLSSEYIVATKQVTDSVTVTGGLGWGRLAGRGAFDNPLGLISDSFNNRPDRDFGSGGEVESTSWFRGDVSAFAGLDWQVTDNASVQLEFSPDLYERELEFSEFDVTSPINAAVQYRFDNDATFRAFTIGGELFGAQFSFFLDPSRRVVAAGAEPGPQPLVPGTGVAASWGNTGPQDMETRISQALADEGIRLERLDVQGSTATAYIQNQHWDVEAQAAGRAARTLAQQLPPHVATFTLVFQQDGLPLSSVTTQRSDLEDLQYDHDGAWRTLSRASIEGAGQGGAVRPRLDYSLSPYLATSYFDPQSPIRADVGPQLDLTYLAAPGVMLAGRFRYPLAGNLDESIRASDSILPRVRSESHLYANESDFEINRLTAEYLWRPGDEIFARVTGGYLENMFGGLSGEVLWRPVDSRFAFGADINYAKQRDFDMLFGFQDYDVVTGHASAYYDIGNGFHARVDAGRYLAGDWGGTFALHREFNNNVRVGGYFTLTDVPFSDFGEGSFDKGIEIEFPLSWFTGKPSRLTAQQTIRPVLRDGGARLQVDNRLYPLTREYGGPELSDGWGRYLR